MMPSISFSYQTLFNHIFSAEQIICPQTSKNPIIPLIYSKRTGGCSRAAPPFSAQDSEEKPDESNIGVAPRMCGICVCGWAKRSPHPDIQAPPPWLNLWRVSWIKLRLLTDKENPVFKFSPKGISPKNIKTEDTAWGRESLWLDEFLKPSVIFVFCLQACSPGNTKALRKGCKDSSTEGGRLITARLKESKWRIL